LDCDRAPPWHINLQKHMAAVNEKKMVGCATFAKDPLPFGEGLERGTLAKDPLDGGLDSRQERVLGHEPLQFSARFHPFPGE
jgi:hypothetical protein